MRVLKTPFPDIVISGDSFAVLVWLPIGFLQVPSSQLPHKELHIGSMFFTCMKEFEFYRIKSKKIICDDGRCLF